MSTSVPSAFRDSLRLKLAATAIQLSEEQIAALERHYALLVKWNGVLNLTRITSLGEVVERHFGESLLLGWLLPAGQLRIVDVGSGAGFPGLPIAILRPECQVTLVESHQRKSVFLKEAARDLPHVRVLAQRAEAVHDTFDWLVSRAVSYEDLAKTIPALASNVALLSGAEEPSPAIPVVWSTPVQLPWGKQQFLRRGAVVPR